MHLLRTTKLRTPESIELDFTLAGIGNRALALGIDYTILTLGLTLIILALNWLAEPMASALAALNWDSDTLTLWVVAIILLIFFVIYVGYFAIFEALWQGQTLGKRWINIRVIQDNGRPIGIAQSALRAILRPIDDILLLGLCFLMFGQQEKRIGDWVAGTLVIQEENAVLAPVLLAAGSEAVVSQLLANGTPISLTPSELAIVVNFLQRRTQLHPKARVQVSRQLVSQIQERLSLDPLLTSEADELVLEAIYRIMQSDDHQ